MDKKNKQAVAVAAVSLLVTFYRMGTPFLKETKKLKKQADELKANIQIVQQESTLYGKGWEDNIVKQEDKVAARLPETLPADGVLDYFLTQFEQKNPGLVKFGGVDYQRAVLTDVKGISGARARMVRHKIRAEMDPSLVIKYMDHVEKYPSLVQIVNFNFNLVQGRPRGLDMEILLDFWLMPREWVPPGKAIPENEIAAEPAKDSKEEKEKDKKWKLIFGNQGENRAPAEVKGGEAISGVALPKFEALIGNAVIINEVIYEEGDSVAGWKLIKVNPEARTVKMSNNGVTKEIKIP